jgi:hypothetical protein
MIQITGILYVHNINWLTFLMEARCVLYDVRTEYLHKIQMRFFIVFSSVTGDCRIYLPRKKYYF